MTKKTVPVKGVVRSYAVVLAAAIHKSCEKVKASEAGEPLKAGFEEFAKTIKDAAGGLDEEAQWLLADDFETFAKEAIRSAPRLGMIVAVAKALTETLAMAGGLASPSLAALDKIMDLLDA